MKVTMLGTGTFFATHDRSGPAYLLETDGKKILIDCGPGTLIRLSEVGVKPEDLDYVFITHFHPDHAGDLFALQMNIRLSDAFVGNIHKNLEIYGPNGIQDFTQKLSDVYQLPAFNNYEKIKYLVTPDGVSIGNIIVKSFKVEHIAFGKSADALALRFEVDGKSFVFSGDTNNNVGIADACREADLFICDSSYPKGQGTSSHLDTHNIAEICENGGVKKLVLTHFYPINDGIDLVSEVREKFNGEIVYGKDLMELEV